MNPNIPVVDPDLQQGREGGGGGGEGGRWTFRVSFWSKNKGLPGPPPPDPSPGSTTEFYSKGTETRNKTIK